MCELSGVEPSQVGVALAKALGVERRSLCSVVEWLRDKQLLIVLDAYEDAIGTVAELVPSMVRAAPRLRVLATSHEPFDAEGERVVRLDPLDTAGDAIDLFLQRAQAAGADVGADRRTRSLVRELCEAVAGLPLSIEIAASNAGSLSLGDIVEAVRSGELLGTASEGRRRSVADALDLTFGRLESASRDAFLRCAVFVGSFDRAAFAAIAVPSLPSGEVLGMLRRLVDRSLISSETRGERTRFRVLEPVRAYAELRCAPEVLSEARRAFVQHYVAVAEHAAVSLRGPDEA